MLTNCRFLSETVSLGRWDTKEQRYEVEGSPRAQVARCNLSSLGLEQGLATTDTHTHTPATSQVRDQEWFRVGRQRNVFLVPWTLRGGLQ